MQHAGPSGLPGGNVLREQPDGKRTGTIFFNPISQPGMQRSMHDSGAEGYPEADQEQET